MARLALIGDTPTIERVARDIGAEVLPDTSVTGGTSYFHTYGAGDDAIAAFKQAGIEVWEWVVVGDNWRTGWEKR